VELTDLPDDPPRLTPKPDMDRLRRVVWLGSFVMLAMMTQYMVNAADTMMVGRLEGAEATASLAALALAMPLFWAIGGFFSAVSYGTQAMTARRFAEGQRPAAGQVLFNSLVVATFCGLLGTAIGWFLSPNAVAYLAQASDQQRELCTSYLQIRSLGIVGMVMTFSYKAFFDGIGRTHAHLVAALVMNVTNIGLNYLMIYGNDELGIPRMGLDGAAWASSASTFIGLAIMGALSVVPETRKTYRFYRLRNRDPKVMWNVVRLMLPSGSATVILMTGFLLFLKFVGQIDAAAGSGNTYSAATKAVMETMGFCFMPLIAFGTATATAVSQSLGAGKPNLAASYGWDSARLCVAVMILVCIALWIWPEAVLTMWSPNDPAVVEAGIGPLRLAATSLPMMAVGLVLSQALYGAGANLFVMVAEGALHFVLFVPLSYVMGPYMGWGILGIWGAAVIYVNALGIVMGTKFLSRGWREIEI
jgi:putative MATE family efflux protein